MFLLLDFSKSNSQFHMSNQVMSGVAHAALAVPEARVENNVRLENPAYAITPTANPLSTSQMSLLMPQQWLFFISGNYATILILMFGAHFEHTKSAFFCTACQMKVQCDHLSEDSYVEIMCQMASDLKKWRRWSRLWQCLCELPYSLFAHFISLKLIFTVNFLPAPPRCSARFTAYSSTRPQTIIPFRLIQHPVSTQNIWTISSSSDIALVWSLICSLLYHQLVQDSPWQEDHAVWLRKCGCRVQY